MPNRALLAPEAEASAELLIVDDDEGLRRETADYLSSHGYRVHEAGDVPAARRALERLPIRLVILDVMLPGEDGLSLCRSLVNKSEPSVLMLSAMGESIDRVLGLELGADDYVVKPVAPRELLARVRALLRRRGGDGRGAIQHFAGFRLDLVRRQVWAPDGTLLMLTPGEIALLAVFVENPRRVLSREALMRLSRGEGADVLERAVDIQISRLRRKLNSQSGEDIIKTSRGAGYMLDAAVVRR